MSSEEGVAPGRFTNRFSLHGRTSPLEFFEATGFSVYRLRVQLRMANGLFKLSRRNVYADTPCSYGPASDV